jgi:hypothetical protein
MLVAAGVALLCLAFPVPIIGDLFYTAGFLLLAYGVMAAIYSSGQRRAFWVGFVILFGGYCSYSIWPGEMRMTWAFSQQGSGMQGLPPRLITSAFLSYAFEAIHLAVFTARGQFTPSLSNTPMAGAMIGQYISFLVIGHSLIALGLGVVGGRVAQRLALQAGATNYRSLEEILQEVDSPSVD